jgi:hypothetical protein
MSMHFFTVIYNGLPSKFHGLLSVYNGPGLKQVPKKLIILENRARRASFSPGTAFANLTLAVAHPALAGPQPGTCRRQADG